MKLCIINTKSKPFEFRVKHKKNIYKYQKLLIRNKNENYIEKISNLLQKIDQNDL